MFPQNAFHLLLSYEICIAPFVITTPFSTTGSLLYKKLLNPCLCKNHLSFLWQGHLAITEFKTISKSSLIFGAVYEMFLNNFAGMIQIRFFLCCCSCECYVECYDNWFEKKKSFSLVQASLIYCLCLESTFEIFSL